MFDLSLAIGHHLLIFILFGVLTAELVLVRPSLDLSTIARTARIDLWYGIVAGLIVIVGFTRGNLRRERLDVLRAQRVLLGEDHDVRRHCYSLCPAHAQVHPLATIRHHSNRCRDRDRSALSVRRSSAVRATADLRGGYGAWLRGDALVTLTRPELT
jgi:putative membrane protein